MEQFVRQQAECDGDCPPVKLENPAGLESLALLVLGILKWGWPQKRSLASNLQAHNVIVT